MMTNGWRGRLSGVGLVLGPPAADLSVDDALERAVAVAVAAEAAGIGTLWVEEASADPPARVPYEAYSMLGALGPRTCRLHLGAAADGSLRRPPSMLAKIVTGVDVVSHGRAALGLDGDTDRPGDADRLGEALEVCRAVLEDTHPRVQGRIYHVEDAVNRPSPVQTDGVPLVVFLAGTGPGLGALAAVCARSADAVVVGDGPGGVVDVLTTMARDEVARRRPGARPLVLGRVPEGTGTPDAVARVRSAGADGCLVGVPFPWSVEGIGALAACW
jgi:alkanesulfonate monooxygenase SsuD/methylene tetrahydromethanopterin reductase-like flavin-dependent oxidoreductase (luciferase family)